MNDVLRLSPAALALGAVLMLGPLPAAAQAPASAAQGAEVAAVAPEPRLAAPGSEEEAVLEAVQRLFDAMAARDADAASDALYPEGQFLAVPVGMDAPGSRVMSHPEFVELIGSAGPPVIERMWDARVLVHGPIAVVWTPYDLYLGEEFSHCGVDAFTMLRTDEGWKVAGGIYTLERDGCPESPLGEPEVGAR